TPLSAAASMAAEGLVAALLRARVPAIVDPAGRKGHQGEHEERGEEAPRVDRGQEDPHDDEQCDGAEDEEAGDLEPERPSIVVHRITGSLPRARATSSRRDDRPACNRRGPRELRGPRCCSVGFWAQPSRPWSSPASCPGPSSPVEAREAVFGAAWEAVQTSPEARVARALIRSVPGRSAIRRRISKEPLGARVMAVSEATRMPLRRSVTFQGTPFRFWSTSNSTSMRPSSRLSSSLLDDCWVQVPRTVTPRRGSSLSG